MGLAYADPAEAVERNELPLPVAFLLSIVLSILVAVAGMLIFDRPHRPPAKPRPLHVVLLQLPTPPAPPLVAPPPDALPPPPPPVIIPVTQAGRITEPPTMPPPPRPRPLRRHPRVRTVARPEREPATTAPSPVAAASAPPATKAVPPSAELDPAARDSLEARIKAAIKAVFQYPEVARMMGSSGTALVGFVYRDRMVLSVHIVQSSRSPVLDRAAVQIVRQAAMPPPGKLAGQPLDLVVPIEFDLQTDDD